MESGSSPRIDHPLGVLLAPQSVAIIGASADANKAGAKVLRSMKATGYGGRIHLVNPTQQRIADAPCYPTVEAVPEPVDLAAICVPAVHVPDVIRACGRAGVRAAIVYAEGFQSAPDRAALRAALTEAHASSGLRMLGPNTLGIRNSASWSYITFSWRWSERRPPGTVATISQSGGMGSVFGKAALRLRGLGPRYVIDTGNEFDVTAAECIEYVALDPVVTCIAVVIEGCHDGQRLVDAVRHARALQKPVVFLKSGRSQAALEQVASHTGALAGRAEVFDAVLRDAGACLVQDEGELLDAVMLHGAQRVPKGRGLGVVTPSGGYGILNCDAAARFGMDLPVPSVAMTVEQKKVFAGAHLSNPFDMSAGVGGGTERWLAALYWMASQPGIDALLVWMATMLTDKGEQDMLYPVVEEAVRHVRQPLFICGLSTPDIEQKLRDIGVLVFNEPTRLVKALSLVAPRALPSMPAPPAPHAVKSPARRLITGAAARALLAGIPHVTTHVVDSVDACHGAMRALKADKVVLKVESQSIAHKTEMGLVSEPLLAGELSAAFEKMCAARSVCGDADAPIVMQTFERGVELALGGFVDAVFGPVVMVAAGGIYLEITRDTTFAQAPVSKAKAMEMLLSLKAAPILAGARGKGPADIDAAADAVAAFSEFFAAHAERYGEVDINPLMVRAAGRGVVAVDALLVET